MQKESKPGKLIKPNLRPARNHKKQKKEPQGRENLYVGLMNKGGAALPMKKNEGKRKALISQDSRLGGIKQEGRTLNYGKGFENLLMKLLRKGKGEGSQRGE